MTRVLLCAVPVCIAAVGIPSAGASPVRSRVMVVVVPAPAVHVVTPSTSRFCTYAQSASKTNVSSAAIESPKSLEAAFAKLKTEEPTVIALVPKQIKGDFQTLFNYFNKFYGELAAVKYNFLALPRSYLTSLGAYALSVKSAALAIEKYLASACAVPVKG